MSAQPPLPTSSVPNPIDISHTESATHVYVKQANPQSLCPKFEGPYKIVSRPSRSQVEVRVGSYADGSARLLTFNWASCKIAHLRDDSFEVSRAPLGRRAATPDSPEPPSDSAPQNKLKPNDALGAQAETEVDIPPSQPVVYAPPSRPSSPSSGAKIQTDSGTNSSRPVRSTRNPNPSYVDAISTWEHDLASCHWPPTRRK